MALDDDGDDAVDVDGDDDGGEGVDDGGEGGDDGDCNAAVAGEGGEGKQWREAKSCFLCL